MPIDFSNNPLALAPLAGYTDLPFRKMVKKFGADITFSEMISANALAYDSTKTLHMLKKSEIETPYIVQIAGSNIDNIVKAINVLNKLEGVDGIDLNCGCPVPKIISQNAGSSLLKDLPLMQKIIETIKKHSNKQYTSVKVRIGYTEKVPTLIAKAVQNAGADFISMHGRTRSGGYTSKIDYDAIKQAKEAISIPLFANGDIISYDSALHVRKHTRCEGLMIGRGAIGNPWIFYQIKNNLPCVKKDLLQNIVLEHLSEMIDFYGEHQGIIIFRKHLHAYSKGLNNATIFRNEINKIDNEIEASKLINDFFK